MSDRSKATDIPLKVKQKVGERDNWTCTYCGGFFGRGIPNSHYIKRSQGGLGIERNIVCHCARCHNEYDNGRNPKPIKEAMKRHLKRCYKDWNESELYYNKGDK